MPKILKKNKAGYGYNYADLNSLLAFIEGEGIDIQQSTRLVDGVEYVYTTYTSEGAEPYTMQGVRVVVPHGTKNDVQGYMAAVTYARRYSIMLNLGISADDDDAICCNIYVPADKDTAITDLKKIVTSDKTKATVLRTKLKQMGENTKLADLEYDTLIELFNMLR